MKFLIGLLFLSGSLSVLASGNAASASKGHLYKNLGGKNAISAVVDDFVGRCATDPRISKFFLDTANDPQRLKALKTNLTEQICQASGGPCKYRGKNMREAHAGMGIRKFHFDALVENLGFSLDKFKVSEKDKKSLVALLAPMEHDIVSVPRRKISSEIKPAPPAKTKP